MSTLPEHIIDEILDQILHDDCSATFNELVEMYSSEYEEYGMNADILGGIIDEAGLGQCDKCEAWTRSEEMYHGTCHLCLTELDNDDDGGIRKMRDNYGY